jgi:iron complex outermembrane receptor protein
MSELMNVQANRDDFRRRLLTGVSMLALLALAIQPSKVEAADSDADRPTVWIELGGQLESMQGTGQAYAPAFIAAYKTSPVFQPASPSEADKPPRVAIGGESKISFEPAGMNWILSASALYGRSNGDKHVHNQTAATAGMDGGFGTGGVGKGLADVNRFADTKAVQNEDHAIVDFRAGKDVGLGMFGNIGKSIVSLGVRFAQYSSGSHVNIDARPDLSGNPTKFNHLYFHDYTASAQSRRSFRGVGPSVSWDASANVVGSRDNGEIALDWGADVAVLFGRQKASTSHNTTAIQHKAKYYVQPDLYQHAGHDTRARSVTVPNLDGFAGISFNYAAAKVSFGYRGDIFFGAVDGGWDTAHRENLTFHGPYATLSVGLGG